MRLHRLELQAFGPYGGSEAVDFDAVSAHGLHLIHGATGAGKTSILDAICFALYGRVPGVRSGQRETLVSDHADAGTRPFVRLEFTASGRRLRIERSPEYTAPKKRGSGVTRRQAKVVVEERRGGQWAGLATRLDEAGEIVHDLLGMHLDQFAQVVLLPQGEFAHFLRAKPEERGAVLRKLFDITRFSDVEDYLVDRRRSLRSTVERFEQQIHADLARAEEALCAVDIGIEIDQWYDCDPNLLPEHLKNAATSLQNLSATVLAEADHAETERDARKQALTTANTTLRLQAQAADARTTIDRYTVAGDDRRADLRRLDRARAADLIAPHRREHARRTSECEVADHDYGTALAGLPAHAKGAGTDASDHDTAALRAQANAGQAALQAASSVTARITALTERIDTETGRAEQASETLELVTTQLRDGDTRLRQDTETLREAERVAAQLTASNRHLELIDAAQKAQATLAGRRADQDRARAATQDAAHRFDEAERTVLAMRRRRLDGIAAELALELSDGAACTVCGSLEHPAPATTAADHVHAADVESAEHSSRQAADALGTARQRESATAAHTADADAALSTAFAALTGAGTACPDEPGAAALDEELTARREQAAAQVDAAQKAERQRVEVLERLEELQAELERLRAEQTRARELHTVTVTTLESARSDLAEAQRRLRAALADHERHCVCDPAPAGQPEPMETVRARHEDTVRAIDEFERAATARSAARTELARASAAVQASLEQHGFDTVEDAAEAELAAIEQERLQAALDAANTEYAAAEAVLGLPQIREAEAADPADIEQLQAAVTEATHTARAARERQVATERAGQSLQALHARLASTLERSAPVRTELATIEPLTDVVTGDGDNQLRMRLTSYVLAARLETVTALANEKLQVMTGGRFTLEHSDALARRGAKSGLGLRVRDAWTGVARDTATLSGGESFMASLALALALGDAVLQTSGGRSLQTLFVDEGFGTLDEASLEQVMEVLDGLRSGGRAVGIVSHVRELRDRIPAQIHVRKTAGGSTIDVVGLRDHAA